MFDSSIGQLCSFNEGATPKVAALEEAKPSKHLERRCAAKDTGILAKFGFSPKIRTNPSEQLH